MRFRPSDIPSQGDPDPGGPVQWADNWLSNYMAWFSHHYLSRWCQTPAHTTSRLTEILFTDCPCCLLWRGLALGYLVGLAVGCVVGAVVLWAVLTSS